MQPLIQVVMNDLPEGVDASSFVSGMVAIDTETTGLDVRSEKLCLVQVGDGQGRVWLVKYDVRSPAEGGAGANYAAPRLRALLEHPRLTKIFHFARFDLAILQRHLGLGDIGPVFCTKIASKLARPAEGKHSLRTLCQELLEVTLDKSEQLSDWTVAELSESQQAYAASDVLYLHALHDKLVPLLAEQNLNHAMVQALKFLATRVELDLRGWPEHDVLAHH
jgi:ribonuclease D